MGSVSIVLRRVSQRGSKVVVLVYQVYPILEPLGWPLHDPAPSTRAARKYLLLRKGSTGS